MTTIYHDPAIVGDKAVEVMNKISGELLASVRLRRNADGKEVTIGESYRADDGCHGTVFYWTDGNFGCDCNRTLAFERACGNTPGLDDSGECGDGRYTVMSITDASGVIVYAGEEETVAP